MKKQMKTEDDEIKAILKGTAARLSKLMITDYLAKSYRETCLALAWENNMKGCRLFFDST